MKYIIMLLGILILASGCTVYVPSSIDINNEASGVDVRISEDDTEVNIDIKERPREFTVYKLKEPELIQAYCEDIYDLEFFKRNISMIAELGDGNDIIEDEYDQRVISIPVLEAYSNWRSNDFKFLKYKGSRFSECRVRFTLRFDRKDYVDGILARDDSEYIHENDLFGYEDFELNCSDYIDGISNSCKFYTDDRELENFLKSEWEQGRMIMSELSER